MNKVNLSNYLCFGAVSTFKLLPYGLILPYPSASHPLLPMSMGSSVLLWWLAFKEGRF